MTSTNATPTATRFNNQKKEKAVFVTNGIRRFLDEREIPYVNAASVQPDGQASFSVHLKSLVYAQLSNQTRWINIAPRLPAVDELFFHYDKEKILLQSSGYFVAGIRALKCGNRCIQKQMDGLHANIRTLEEIERKFGGLDNFLTAYPPDWLVDLLSRPGSAYKLRHIGYALAWEYLRGVGLDAAKPDVHLTRILGRSRLGFSANPVAREAEVNPMLREMAAVTGLTVSIIDNMLWAFCASGYGGMCTAKPDCARCCIAGNCNTGKRHRRQSGGETP